MIPVKDKSPKQVYMKINQLHKLFGHHFSDVFKSITFDNGSEFARFKDIEVNLIQLLNVLPFTLHILIALVSVVVMRTVMVLFVTS